MKRIYWILTVLFMLSSCVVPDDNINIGIGGVDMGPSDTTIAPSCVVESREVSRAKSAGIAVRSLIDQITAKQMDANFLRLDEDLNSENDGMYTFTGSEASTPYLTNWNKAILLEATVISSPDNTTGIHYRSVSLAPEQSYKMNIVEHKVDGEIIRDTTHFYHTRMVGWYPMNCRLPRKEGVPATAQFDYSAFDAVRINETVEIDGVPTEVVALQFTGLDGETDLMVSDVCEGQSWHLYNATTPHKSDVHPDDSSNIYREPFGHNFSNPEYSNFFTYRHYRSAIRVTAYAEQSTHNLMMWGEIRNVVIRNQPTSCKLWLPTRLGEFGEVYHWGDYENMAIVHTSMFDNDSNHPEYHQEAKYPINMKGSSSDNDYYLGYSLVEPHRDIELEIHTGSGVYSTTVSAKYEVTDANGNKSTVNLFEPGYIYDIKLNLQTDGTIGAILHQEGEEHYYDLTMLHEFEVNPDQEQTSISTYKLSNCYVVDPEVLYTDEGKHYDGYCFLALVVGNGAPGIISSGAQTLYPTHEEIRPVSAHLLWESQLGLVSDVELKFGYVRFKIPDTKARGNAVIAVYDADDNVLWSWHIWITDMPGTQSFTMGDHEITFLDRNLGATAATCNSAETALATYGLYYQWGRKDPSMGPPTYNYSPINLNTAPYYDFSSDQKSAAEVTQFAQPTLRNGVENPMYLILPSAQPLSYIFNWTYELYNFLWGYDHITGKATKTIYDPCPYGYRVPSSELSALFATGSGSAGTYGYTRTVNGTQFFFPYTGFKGVDVGLNSLAAAWKYVGEKGDYQSSTYCDDANDFFNNGGVISLYMHRSRIYVSKSNSWSETNVGDYSGNMHNDFANRRTAAPVRCVKDETIGSIRADISSSVNSLEAGATTTLTYTASSYGSIIDNVKIIENYTNTSGQSVERVVRQFSNVAQYVTEGSISYIMPTDCNDKGLTIQLVVRNEHGLQYSDKIALKEFNLEVSFNRWEDSLNNTITNSNPGYAIVGQQIKFYVNVSSDKEPSLVTINGATATQSGYFDGSASFNTTWYVTMSKDSKGVYDVPVEATMDGKETEITLPLTVYGLALGNATTSIDTSGKTMYLLQNNNYTSTYLRVTATDTTVAANTSQNYYNLFTVNGQNIKSVARGTYLQGTNGTVSLNATGTNYTIAANGNYMRISVTEGSWFWQTTYYLRQTSNTAVAMANNDSNNNWRFYPVTYDIP